MPSSIDEDPEERKALSLGNDSDNAENDVETGTLGFGISTNNILSPTGKEDESKLLNPTALQPQEEMPQQQQQQQQVPRESSGDEEDQYDDFYDSDLESFSQCSQEDSQVSSDEEQQPLEDKLSESRWGYYERILVLVNLELLNSVSNETSLSSPSPPTTPSSKPPTSLPVNKYGFPVGYGRTQAEQSGPYLYVACAYKQIRRMSASLREDSNNSGGYVTVERCDTGEWMTIRPDWETHVLEDSVAIRSALFAAKICSKDKDDADYVLEMMDFVKAQGATTQEQLDVPEETTTFWYNDLLHAFEVKVVPKLERTMTSTKAIATQLVQGGRPFSCKVRITGINVVVVCSILFLFLQVFQLGFLPPEWDAFLNWLGCVVWSILVSELIFEILIRPPDYKQLMNSDKAYRPSTARHIAPMFVAGETIALLLYIPEIVCLDENYMNVCLQHGLAGRFTLVKASATAVLGPTGIDSLLGRLVLGAIAFRFFGVVRHWQHMLIQQTFRPIQRVGLEKWVIPFDPAMRMEKQKRRRKRLESKKQNDDDNDEYSTQDDDTVGIDVDDTDIDFSDSKENRRLKSAANIGTAIIVVNCQRALILMVLAVLVVPLFYIFSYQNLAAVNLTKLLSAENLVSTTGYDDCEYLEEAIDSWLNIAITNQLGMADSETEHAMPYILWAQVLPVRCPFQKKTGVVTSCSGKQSRFRTKYNVTCGVWDYANPPQDFVDRKIDTYRNTEGIREYFAQELDIRGDGIIVNQQPPQPNSFQFDAFDQFTVTVVFDENPTIEMTNRNEFWLVVVVFFLGLIFLMALQNDVYRLALNPIQRMLSIVIRYAENPLDVEKTKNLATRDDDDGLGHIGDIETEQLLSAITKISDLLRKCWGVAGAGIISSNLGREKDGQVAVFNPTVPGKQVYALFGFVTICGYSKLLKALDGDVMILINDIASVVHNEVYRWALGEHGQCNKNLGPAFLMVWRIGDFNEVQQKNKAAIEKLFRDKVYKTTTKTHPNLRRRNVKSPYSKNSSIYSNATTVRSLASASSTASQEIQLESLPGIQGFADRALLGMLKSFAGLHRDRYLQEWKNDPRLKGSGRAGYSAYTVDVIYGMDAGWAVEGAVGSEYKIDATYLSPHVNMASRMMSASKQYGATILLSKAVEKILSKSCRTKLRHLDTVYVKGSAIKQAIYTYDARYAGVDFFLLERTPEQADHESSSYTPSIWEQDQDLLAMRRHVTDEFLETYHSGVKQYLEGNWKEAYDLLQVADDTMIRTVLEEGYIEIADDELLETLEARIVDKTDKGEDVVKLREEFGDGASRTLMSYIERRNFQAPEDWKGVRQLFSK